MQSIYLDQNATTPLLPEVAAAMADCYAAAFANPASQHAAGRKARQILEDAREGIAELVGADLHSTQPDELIFTSGGTEANNLAIFGLAQAAGSPALQSRHSPGVEDRDCEPSLGAGLRTRHTLGAGLHSLGAGLRPRRDPDRHTLGAGLRPRRDPDQESPGRIIAARIEHPSVLGPIEQLHRQGWHVDWLRVTRAGQIDLDHAQQLIAPTVRSAIATLMLGNNETGVLQPVAEFAALAGAAGIPVHTDAVQVAGKLPIDFRALGVATMSLAAHKFHGPRGIGALVVRHGVRLAPQLFGGFQQNALRPGTENVALAVGMHRALQIWHAEHAARLVRMTQLRDRFEAAILSAYPQAVIHGQNAPRLPHTSNIAFPGLNRQALMMALDLAGVACSTGSACASGSTDPSLTLVAMGLENELLESSLRFSLGTTTTADEVDEAARRISNVCKQLQPAKNRPILPATRTIAP